VTGVDHPPVFIVGSPRSGTFLLRNILNRHPALAICGETHFNYYVYTRRRAFGDLSNPKNRQRLVAEFLALRRIQRLGMDLPALSERLSRDATSYQAFFRSVLEHYAESQGKKRWGEKTPQHAFFTETLCEWYPGAVILHLVRDPRDVVGSLQRMPWAANNVVANARVWLNCNRAAMKSRHRPGYLLVHYEELVSHPERELVRICTHLGEEYVPEMLEPAAVSIPLAGKSKRARGPVTTDRLGRWRVELTADEVTLVEWIAGGDMVAYGYHRAAQPPSRLAIARGLGAAAWDTFRRRLPQLPGIWYHVMRPTKLAKEEFWMHSRWMRQALADSLSISKSAGPRG
jgi:hypothetical protein